MKNIFNIFYSLFDIDIMIVTSIAKKIIIENPRELWLGNYGFFIKSHIKMLECGSSAKKC